jgi:RHS repeat-associated protein
MASKAGVSYTYGDANHVHAVTSRSDGKSYQYDSNGNMTYRNLVGDGIFNLGYDAENRMIQVTGAYTATFGYNGDGQRILATEGITTTIYIGNYFEWTVNDSTKTKYYYAGGTRIAMRDRDDNLLWLLSDHLGSASVVANANGSENGKRGYYPWGTARLFGGNDVPTDYRFTGQREEPQLKLYFYNARWYDPQLGRFIQPDSIIPDPTNLLSFDRFAYVYNSPTKYVDPSGHCIGPLGVVCVIIGLVLISGLIPGDSRFYETPPNNDPILQLLLGLTLFSSGGGFPTIGKLLIPSDETSNGFINPDIDYFRNYEGEQASKGKAFSDWFKNNILNNPDAIGKNILNGTRRLDIVDNNTKQIYELKNYSPNTKVSGQFWD